MPAASCIRAMNAAALVGALRRELVQAAIVRALIWEIPVHTAAAVLAVDCAEEARVAFSGLHAAHVHALHHGHSAARRRSTSPGHTGVVGHVLVVGLVGVAGQVLVTGLVDVAGHVLVVGLVGVAGHVLVVRLTRRR